MVHVYYSEDAIWHGGDTVLLKRPKKIRKLKPGKVKKVKFRVPLDQDPSDGYLIMKVDSQGAIGETDETNNEIAEASA